MKTKTQSRGFTLMDLIVTMIIVGILAAIALPSYSKYVQRSGRALARTTLEDLAARQDVYRLQTRAFATTFAPINKITGTTFFIDRGNNTTAAQAGNSIYEISIDNGSTASSYTLTATAVGNQTLDSDCTKLILSSVGTRTATGSSSTADTDCWTK